MVYFDKEKIEDIVLRESLTDTVVEESTEYIEDIARRCKVNAADIANPPTYPVRVLAMNYAMMLGASNLSAMNGSSGDSSAADSYELKRRVFKENVDKWEAQITAETLTGGASAGDKVPLSIPIERR